MAFPYDHEKKFEKFSITIFYYYYFNNVLILIIYLNFSSFDVFFLGVNFQTDTASVLLEAIQYIKFLQEQVQVITNLQSISFLDHYRTNK